LLAALRPMIAIVSAGWRNRFHHPAPDVVARYAAIGATLVNTADAGAVRLAFPADAPPRIVARERGRQWRYWREGAPDADSGAPPGGAASTPSQTASAALL
jgi:competence protein ComEC